MKIKEVEDLKAWNQFVTKNNGSFLQSWEWGDLKSEYQKIYRLGFFEGSNLKAVAQIFEEYLPFGNYFYIPYGPVVSKKEILGEVIDEIRNFSKKKTDFVRVEPIQEIKDQKESFSRFQPKKTLILNLKEEKELLNGFDKDTRYCIRRAKKEGVKVKEAGDVDAFYELLKLTAKRHNFNIYKKEYFERLLKYDFTHLFVATHEKDTLVAAFSIFFGNTATYLHAGSLKKKSKMCASSLLNFEVMNEAFKAGLDKYDFWGIDKQEMPGVTKFKKGFGGTEKEYPKAKDMPISKKYLLYKFIYKIKSSYGN